MPLTVPARYRIYLGIDPGKSGGLVWIFYDFSGEITVEWESMPKTELDVFRAVDQYSSSSTYKQVAAIEKVHSMPRQGVASSFTFGRGYGGLRMALVAAGIPFDEVHPRSWQKTLGIAAKKTNESKNQFKDRLRQKAQQLFPDLELWNRTKREQLAVCDALLIAEYCRRLNT